ncbi:MAG: c-type cytochrome [Balneolaceae bacterium]|nr:c-type cytochrome [Balneolaceae bacterium]
MKEHIVWMLVLFTAGFFLMISCEAIIPEAPAEEDLLDGPIAGLSYEEQDQFLKGDIAFNDDVFTPKTGLGPTFVATSCGSCHPGDGKGHPSTSLIRFGQTEPNTAPTISGAPQLQNRAIPGYQPEKLPDGVPFMKMTPPAVTGLGLLAALTDEQILENADPNDEDGDGISGVPSYVTPPDYFIPEDHHQPENGRYIGRFGKKASTVNLLHQTATAYNQDIGVTSTFELHDVYSGLTIDPEVSDQIVRDVVFYLKTLKAPIQRKPNNPDIMRGKEVFNTLQCSSCHTPKWTTQETDIAALSNKAFYPYTDLLLHDMGPGLDDGATEGSAETYEWRTPPLWGLGLSPDSQGGKYFLMHDGRAQSIEEAILLHGGEAQNSRDQFQALSSDEKEALIKFLESL